MHGNFIFETFNKIKNIPMVKMMVKYAHVCFEQSRKLQFFNVFLIIADGVRSQCNDVTLDLAVT